MISVRIRHDCPLRGRSSSSLTEDSAIVLGHVRKRGGGSQKARATKDTQYPPTPLLFSIPRIQVIEPARDRIIIAALAPALLPDTCVRILPSSLFALINDRRRVTRDNVVKSALSADHNRPDARWGPPQKGGLSREISRQFLCVSIDTTALDSILFSILIRDISEIERHFKL